MPLIQLMLTTFFCSCSKDNFNEKPLKTLLTLFNRKSGIVIIINLEPPSNQNSQQYSISVFPAKTARQQPENTHIQVDEHSVQLFRAYRLVKPYILPEI